MNSNQLKKIHPFQDCTLPLRNAKLENWVGDKYPHASPGRFALGLEENTRPAWHHKVLGR